MEEDAPEFWAWEGDYGPLSTDPDPGLCRNCGHPAEDHHRLPGHPDGAEECYFTDDCQCGGFKP